ncbi:coiled-coil domain-containing protein [Bacillus massiliigorillae]|uniref:coiled-coil domain-containing protein n=1 Tax=Bacillus massiliigorillae TaxID=1243664 RepID=UPI0003A9FCBB|nr:glucosaminidase domain-containing protein [Bacillus massiliigorillae]
MSSKKIFILSSSLLITLSFSLSAQAAPSDQSLSDQLNSVNKEASSVQKEIKNKTEAAKEITNQKEQAYNEWKRISLAVADLEVKIYEQTSELLQTKSRISELETKAQESKKQLDKRYDVVSKRLISLQEQDSNFNILSVLLDSESLGDFLNRAMTVSYLMSADKDLIDSYEKEMENYNNLKHSAEIEFEKMKKVQAALNQSKYDLEVQQQKKNALMKNLEKQYGWTIDSIKTLQVEQKQLQQKSSNLAGQIEQKKQQEANQNKENNKVESSTSNSRGYDVRNISNVSAATINGALSGSLSGYGSTFYEVGHSYGIDPAFLAAVAMAETGGNSNWLKKYNNVGGFISNGGPMSFSSINDSIKYMGSLFTRLYLQDGLYTVEAIHTKYSPVGADTDPNNLNSQWVQNVYTYLGKMGVAI